MYRIIDKRGSGKTSRLMLLAKEKNGIFVCSNPDAMKYKAHAYELTGFDIISYYQLVNQKDINLEHKPVFIDELDSFLNSLGYNIYGYSLTDED